MDKNTLDFIGLSMMGMIDDPIVKDMIGLQLLNDTNPDNDMIGLGLMAQPSNFGLKSVIGAKNGFYR